MGSDDILPLDAIECVVEEIRLNENNVDFYYGDMMTLRENGEAIIKKTFIKSKFYGKFLISHPALYIRKAIFEVSMVTGFKITATILVFLVIVPLILDVKDEEIPLPIVIIFVTIFIIPFLYLSYIWIPEATGVLTFLFSVVLFVILLLITRGQGAK